MANSSSKSGVYSYQVDQAGSNFKYSTTNKKYLTTYAYGTSGKSQKAYNGGKLGDAIIEMYNPSNEDKYMMRTWLQRGCNAYGNNEFCILSTLADGGSDTSGLITTRATLAIY